MSVACQGPFLPQFFPFILAFWLIERVILKEEDLLSLGFLTKDLRDFPKEIHQAGRFWGRVWSWKAGFLTYRAALQSSPRKAGACGGLLV